MRFYFLFLAVASLFVSPAKADDATLLYTIDADQVIERHIFGGLGPSTEPLGALTEFIVEGKGAPLFDIDGMHADRFSSKTVYIFDDGKSYSVCPTEKEDGACLPCPECVRKLQDIAAYDRKNKKPDDNKLTYRFSFSAVEQAPVEIAPNGQYKNARVTFHYPRKGDTFTISGMNDGKIRSDDIMARFGDDTTVYIFKGNDGMHICPAEKFSGTCLPCIDCAEKEIELRELTR